MNAKNTLASIIGAGLFASAASAQADEFRAEWAYTNRFGQAGIQIKAPNPGNTTVQYHLLESTTVAVPMSNWTSTVTIPVAPRSTNYLFQPIQSSTQHKFYGLRCNP